MSAVISTLLSLSTESRNEVYTDMSFYRIEEEDNELIVNDLSATLSISNHGPISCKDALEQPFLSCGVFPEEDDGEFLEEIDGVVSDWGTLAWHLLGFEFIRMTGDKLREATSGKSISSLESWES